MAVVVPYLDRSIDEQLFDRVVRNSAHSIGYETLHAEQIETIRTFLGGKDVFVSLPTGSGKSVCFAIIPLVIDNLKREMNLKTNFSSFIIVVSPLISLMTDQVASLSARGIQAACATGRPRDDFWGGNIQVIYFSPESLSLALQSGLLKEEQPQHYLVGIAIDEAHCISEWLVVRYVSI